MRIRRTWSHLATALVATTITATTAVGATLVVTSSNIKNGTIQLVDIAPKARTALKGQRGPAGATGAAGTAGATGPQGPSGSVGVNGAAGEPGQTGSAGPSLLASNGAVSNGAVTWMSPGGGGVGSEAGAQRPIPPGTNLVARDLAIRSIVAVNGAGVIVTLRVNGANSALSCTIPAGQQSCTSTQTVALAPGDLISIRIDSTGSTVDTAVNATFKLVF